MLCLRRVFAVCADGDVQIVLWFAPFRVFKERKCLPPTPSHVKFKIIYFNLYSLHMQKASSKKKKNLGH